MVVGGVAPGMMTGRPAQMMGFIDAIRSVFLINYANFSGRASRSEYWWQFLFAILFGMITGIVDGFLFGWGYYDPTWITWIFRLAIFLPTMAVGIRRIHDHGNSGWWILMPFAIIYFAIAEGEATPNAYGPVPTNELSPY
jgi:uncharacterized membrane protein YhaH (DUF805 family)